MRRKRNYRGGGGLKYQRLLPYCFILIVPAAAILCGRSTETDSDRSRVSLLETDRAFSAYSQEHGVAPAFGKFMADSAAIYRSRSLPVRGREAVLDVFRSYPEGTLTWEPQSAEAAASGDLGYTLGRAEFVTTDSIGNRNVYVSFYVTIWKKQPDGTWKWVFDSGVPGPDSTAVK